MNKAIVVGATSGIGRGLAKRLVENGYKVGITGRRLELLTEIQSENVDNYCIKPFDIADLNAIPNCLDELVRELGGLHLLVICAAMANDNERLEFAIEKQIIDTNVLGFAAVVNWSFNFFKETENGHLVAITSVSGLHGSKHGPSYSASKSFQINYLEGMRQKVNTLKMPIFITDIRPGFVDTPMAKSKKRFWVSPIDKAVKQIIRNIKSKKRIAYVTNRWLLIAILMKLAPNWLYNKI